MDISELKRRLLPLNHQDSFDKNDQIEQQQLKDYLQATGIKPMTSFRQAAVLIPIVQNIQTSQWDVILTKRAKHLKNHPGEISFPGGRFEPQDGHLQFTAIRETQEEIGIKQQHVELIGRLPRQNTISQYQVTPFVGIIKPQYSITIDRNEVDEAFLVPLEFAINSSNQQIRERELNNNSFSFYVIQYNDYHIWGATAKMLVNFRKILSQSEL